MLKQYIEKITNIPIVKLFLSKAMKFTLPGFEKLPVYNVLLFLLQEIKKDQIPTRARSIAYSFFMAFFPGIIFLLTLLPYIPLQSFQIEFIKLINEIVPDKVAQDFIITTLDELLNKPREGLLSLGAFFTLYFSTQGVVSMILSFNKTHAIYNQRNIFQQQWVALKLTVILFLLFIASIILIIVGGQLIKLLVTLAGITSTFTIVVLNITRYLVIILLFFLSISFIYYYGPSTKKKFKFISPGSTFATIVSILASVLFSYYVSSIGKYDSIYGVFGSIIIFLVWMYINAFVLLIGFELNASIYYNQTLHRQQSEEDSIH
jgi:membrane protein